MEIWNADVAYTGYKIPINHDLFFWDFFVASRFLFTWYTVNDWWQAKKAGGRWRLREAWNIEIKYIRCTISWWVVKEQFRFNLLFIIGTNLLSDSSLVHWNDQLRSASFDRSSSNGTPYWTPSCTHTCISLSVY